jgi:hypothetical protein
MEESNVHTTEPTDRDDLKHVDTVSTDRPDETPEGARDQDAPIGIRVGQDPSNLGDDVAGEGDLTHPAPNNEPLGRAPAM